MLIRPLIQFYLNNTINLRHLTRRIISRNSLNGDRIVTTDSVTPHHPMYTPRCECDCCCCQLTAVECYAACRRRRTCCSADVTPDVTSASSSSWRRIASSTAGVFCVFWYGLTVSLVVTQVGKLSAGRLRPHFIDVCRPDFTAINCSLGLAPELN